jgi:Cu+-exporting ATPase
VIEEIERDAQTILALASEEDRHETGHGKIDRLELARVAFVAVAAAAVWFRVLEPFAHFSVIGIVATLIGGYPIFREALENVLERRMTMELSMTIALVAALSIGAIVHGVGHHSVRSGRRDSRTSHHLAWP